MAKRRGKAADQQVESSKTQSSTAKKAKKEVSEDDKQPETSQGKRKTLGMGKKNTKVVPVRTTPPRASKARQATAKTGAKKQISRVDVEDSPEHYQDAQDPDDISDHDEQDTSSQQVARVKGQILGILEQAASEDEEEVAPPDKDKDLYSIDSTDRLSLSGQRKIADTSQLTMEGNQRYSEHPIFDGGDDQDEGDEAAADENNSEGDLDVSKMRMVPEQVDYNDPSKSHEEWWSDDPSREATLCALWAEEPTLYDMKETAHRISGNRDTILRKFATVLHVPPPIIYTRMTSLRNMYQKLSKAAPSGSAAVGKTPRQKEVCRLLHFLHNHVKTTETITSYKGKSPAKPGLYSYRTKLSIAKKSTPKKTTSTEASDMETQAATPADDPPDLAVSPIHDPNAQVDADQQCDQTSQEDDDDDSQDSPLIITKKHFSRNERLKDAKAVDLSVRRSLRLSPPKDTENRLKLKSSNKASGSCESTAPLAKTSVPQQTVKTAARNNAPHAQKSAPESATVERSHEVVETITLDDTPPQKGYTALDRYKQMKGKKKADEIIVKKKEPETPERVPLRKVKVATSKLSRKTSDNAVASTSKARSSEVESNASDTPSYGVDIQPVWYEQQGFNYRRQKEKEAEATKKKKAENDPLVQVMKEKSGYVKQMADTFQQMGAQQNRPDTTVAEHSPEQLWANSLVPHLRRMDQLTRDRYMYHVLGLAFKAISGEWPQKQ